jgi:hypothetical protein
MMQGPVFGSFGDSLDEAVRTEFFSWFGLIEDGRGACADGSVGVRYKPAGDKHHQFITGRISVRDEGAMDRVALEVHAAFIDHARDWPHARDITGSFIGAGLANQSDAAQVKELLRDLRDRPQPGAKQRPASLEDVDATLFRGESVPVRRGGGNVPGDLSPIVSRGFAVYNGKREAFVRDLSATRFSMRNSAADGERILVISFARILRAGTAAGPGPPPGPGP